jgi:hypothetical protein
MLAMKVSAFAWRTEATRRPKESSPTEVIIDLQVSVEAKRFIWYAARIAKPNARAFSLGVTAVWVLLFLKSCEEL